MARRPPYLSTRKRIVPLIVAVVVVAGIGFIIVGRPDSLPLPDKTDDSFRVGIANLNYRNKKADRITENLVKSGCELVVLLEWTKDNTNTDMLERSGFSVVLDARKRSTRGIGVLAKRHLNVRASWMESPIDGPCSMPLVVVRFNHENNNYALLGIHVPPPVPVCQNTSVPTLRVISSWVKDGRLVEDKGAGKKGDRVIVAGDLNTLPFNKSLRSFRQSGLKDVFKETGWFPKPTWGMPTWFPAFIRIDYFFAPLDVKVKNTWVIGLPGSDHRGMVVDIAE
jgi:endonuclease/exonuclease/phosphatase (EEP) superfamily protein YafD